jgi:hypothetical protein
MGLKAAQLQKQQVATKEWEKGTEGNEIEPIPGQQLTPEEQEQQYVVDFGDNLDVDTLAGIDLDELLVGERHPMPPTETEEETETVVTPTGQLVTQQKGKPKSIPGISTSDLTNYVAKETHETLQKSYNELQGKFNELQGKMNNVGELATIPLDQLKVLQRIKNDFENSPLGLIVEDYYKGTIDVSKFVPAKGTVQDYLPDGEMFDVQASFSDVSSPSYKARTQFESEQRGLASKYQQAGKFVSDKLKAPTQKDVDDVIKQEEDKLLNELEKKIPAAKKHRKTFIEFLEKQPNLYMLVWPSYVSAIAAAVEKQNKGIKPKPGVSGMRVTGSSGIEDSDKQINDEFGD